MGQRLLVLDADGAFIDEHKAVLELVFDVDFAASSDDVVGTLEGGDYAAALVCAETDDSRGYAVCASLRNHRRLSGFKIVLISSKATKADFERHKKLRVCADHYLHGPIPTETLVSELGAFVPKRASALDGTLDVLMGFDIDENWLASLDSAEPDTKVGGDDTREEAGGAPSWEDAHAAVMGRLITELRAKTMDLAQARQDIAELQGIVAAMEVELGAREMELQTKAIELLEARQDIQQLQRKNDTITVNLEELEECQRLLGNIQERLNEAEDQIRYLESPTRLERYADDILYERMREAVSEKKELLRQVETLTQELAEKNTRAVALIRARETAQQHFVEVEGRMRRVERDFENRVEGERMLLFARMEELKESEAAAKKQVCALEEACAIIGRELEAATAAHAEEKRRLMEDFEKQKQEIALSFRAQREELFEALGMKIGDSREGGL